MTPCWSSLICRRACTTSPVTGVRKTSPRDVQAAITNPLPDPTVYRDAMLAHSSLATVFKMPVVLTTSADTGMSPLAPHSQSVRD